MTPNQHDQTSAEILRSFLIAALETVSQLLEEAPVRGILQPANVFTSEGGLHHTVETRPLWELWMGENGRARLLAMPSTAAAVTHFLDNGATIERVIAHDNDGRDASNRPEVQRSGIYDKLTMFVNTYLLRYGDRPANEALIDRHVTDFIATWCSGRADRQATAPILGLRSVPHTIELEPNVTLEELTPDWKTRRWNDSHRYSADISLHHFQSTQFALVERYQTARAGDSGGGDFHSKVSALLLALRLLKPGGVYVLTQYDEPAPNLLLGGVGSSWSSDWHPPPRFNLLPNYSLEREDSDNLRTLYATLRNHQIYGSVHVAADRFSDAYSRDALEDRVVDLCIALESLLLTGSRSDTKNKPIALKAAVLLRHTRKMKATYRLATALYAARNRIVHDGAAIHSLANGASSFYGFSPGDLPDLAMDLTRDTIRAVLSSANQGVDLPKVSSDLDESILDAWLEREAARQR